MFQSLPPALQSRIDYAVRAEEFLNKWGGGAFNGQEVRKSIVDDIFRSIEFERVVETGTFRGITTRHLATEFAGPLLTIETDARNYHFAKLVLRRFRNVRVVRADSASFLRGEASRWAGDARPTFFYLDAHWHEHLPLLDEIRAIICAVSHFVILIDDFKVPHDLGYGYDDYGPGKVLEPAYLDSIDSSDLAHYYPAVPSSRESGARRGYVFIARGHACVAHLDRDARLMRLAGGES